jgi:hypothetical protein
MRKKKVSVSFNHLEWRYKKNEVFSWIKKHRKAKK